MVKEKEIKEMGKETRAATTVTDEEMGVTSAARTTKGSFVVTPEGKAWVVNVLKQRGNAFKCSAEAFLKKFTDATPEYIAEKVNNKSASAPWWPVGLSVDRQFEELDIKVTGNGKGTKGTLKFVTPRNK